MIKFYFKPFLFIGQIFCLSIWISYSSSFSNTLLPFYFIRIWNYDLLFNISYFIFLIFCWKKWILHHPIEALNVFTDCQKARENFAWKEAAEFLSHESFVYFIDLIIKFFYEISFINYDFALFKVIVIMDLSDSIL